MNHVRPRVGQRRMLTSTIQLEKLLEKAKLQASIFDFITASNANHLRLISQRYRQFVAEHAWHDPLAVVRTARLWHACFPNAKSVNVVYDRLWAGSPALGAELSHLARFPKLKIRAGVLTNAHFGTLTQLVSLDVQGCGQLTGACLQYLPALRELSASRSMSTEDFAILPALEKLDVSVCSVEAVCDFSMLPGLKELTCGSGVSDHAFATLPSTLQRLTMTGCHVTEAVLARTPCLANLKGLTLRRVQQLCGAFFPQMRALETLEANATRETLYLHALTTFEDREGVILSLLRSTRVRVPTPSYYAGEYSTWQYFLSSEGYPTIVKLLQRYKDVPAMREELCYALLTSNVPGGGVDLIPLLLEFLRERTALHQDVKCLLDILFVIAAKASFSTPEKFPQLLSLMRACIQYSSVCKAACATFMSAVEQTPALATLAAACGCTDIFVIIVERHVGDNGVMMHIWSAIDALTLENGAHTECRCASSHLIRVIVPASLQHIQSHEFATLLCCVVARLLIVCEQSKDKFLETETVALLMSVLKLHSYDEAIAVDVCNALSFLVPGNKPGLIDSDGVHLLVTVFEKYSANTEIVAFMCTLLAVLITPELQLGLGARGITSLVMKAVGIHIGSKNTGAIADICDATYRLMAYEERQKEWVACKGVPLLMSALKACAVQPYETSYVLEVLNLLCENKAWAIEAMECGCLPLVMQAWRTYATNQNLTQHACQFVSRMLVVDARAQPFEAEFCSLTAQGLGVPACSLAVAQAAISGITHVIINCRELASTALDMLLKAWRMHLSDEDLARGCCATAGSIMMECYNRHAAAFAPLVVDSLLTHKTSALVVQMACLALSQAYTHKLKLLGIDSLCAHGFMVTLVRSYVKDGETLVAILALLREVARMREKRDELLAAGLPDMLLKLKTKHKHDKEVVSGVSAVLAQLRTEGGHSASAVED